MEKPSPIIEFFKELRARVYGSAYNEGTGMGYTGRGHWENRERWVRSAEGIRNAAYSLGMPSFFRLLELGCGRGTLVDELRKLDILAFGVELGDDVHYTQYMMQGNACMLPIPGRAFDFVIACDVVEHVPTDFQDELHKEMQRVLTDDGVVVVTVPLPTPFTNDARAMMSVADGLHNHYITLPPEEWFALFVKHGWSVICEGPDLSRFGLPFNLGAHNYPYALTKEKPSCEIAF